MTQTQLRLTQTHTHTQTHKFIQALKLNTSHSGVGYYAPTARTTLNPCVFLCSSGLHLTGKTFRSLIILGFRAGAFRYPAGDFPLRQLHFQFLLNKLLFVGMTLCYTYQRNILILSCTFNFQINLCLKGISWSIRNWYIEWTLNFPL
jgi:hypothetical protein